MNRYFESTNKYFEAPKTDSIRSRNACTPSTIKSTADSFVDKRYNTSKATATVIGNVKKQD